MQKKISIRKKQFASLFILMVFSFSFIPSFFNQNKAYAANGDWVFVYDKSDVNNLKGEIAGFSPTPTALPKTKVYTKDPDFQKGNAAGQKTEFTYAGKEGSSFKYTTYMTCKYDDDHQLRTYINVYLPLDGSFNDKNTYNAQREILNYRIINYNLADGDSESPGEGDVKLEDNGGVGVWGSPIGSSCIGLSTIGGRRSIQVDNYQKLTSEAKDAWDKLGVAAGGRDIQAVNARSDEEAASNDDANCEGGGALGWIICPVSELIANFATDMFEDVIAPMLENVPISLKRTGPESGGFQAWQSMRVIANVLLVVSLLAVVYSQAKGGD